MTELCYYLAAFVVLNLIVGGIRIAKGPTRADRMLAGQILGTGSVAIFLLLAEAYDQPSLRNVALVFVALAALSTVAFVKTYTSREGRLE